MHFILKAKHWWFGIGFLVLIGLVIWRPLLDAGMPFTHDGENHLARFANYYLALKEGQIPPRFAPNLMNHYGYPVFNYNYPLANILSVPLTVLKVNLEITFKILTVLSLTWGTVGVWLWLGNYRFSKSARLLSITAYWSAPYILSAVFFRGSIGEVMVYGLLPCLLWWLGRLKQSPQRLTVILGGILFALLLLAHNVTGLLGIGILMIFAILEWGRAKVIWQKAMLSFLIGLGLSLWFWLPAIVESNQVVLLHAGIQKEFLTHLVTLRQLISSPLTFGFSTAEPVDSLSLSMGVVAIFTIWAGLILLIISRICHAELVKFRMPLFSLLLIIGLVFLQSTAATSLWTLFPFAQIIQFPWRLMLFVPILVLPVLAGVWDQDWWTTRILIIVGLLLQIWIASNLLVVDRFHKSNLDYFAFTQSTSTQNENRTVSFTYDNIGNWQPSPVVWAGEADIAVKAWSGSHRQYQIDAKTTVFIIEPTANFLGWQTWAQELESGETKRIHYSNDEDMQGRINFSLSPGRYIITTKFTQQTPARYIGNGVFILTLTFVILLSIQHLKTRSQHAKKIQNSHRV